MICRNEYRVYLIGGGSIRIVGVETAHDATHQAFMLNPDVASSGVTHCYYDKYGNEIVSGDKILLGGKVKHISLTVKDTLGYDVTPDILIENGQAKRFSFGCRELKDEDLANAELIKGE